MAYTKIVGISRLIGLSTDTKPTTGIAPDSLYWESDTLDLYMWTGSAWTKKVLGFSRTERR